MKKLVAPLLTLALCWFLTNQAQSQDTLKVMVYNLLNYGNNSGTCNSTSNNINDKDAYLKTIMDYVKPDVLGVNEMASNSIYGSRILANVLNTDSVNYYRKATYSNQAVSSIVNMLFYDSRKLEMYDEIVVPATVRDINIYTLYYKDSALAGGADTTFLTFVLAHLKAGNSSADQQTRDAMVQTTMSTLKSNNIIGNVIFMGDLNVYRATEPGYQRLLTDNNPDYRFYDPINRQGSWNNNSNFADVHTQSTQLSGPCHSGGGMDDRFDQILSTGYLLGDSLGAQYVDGSYLALGQDGNRFNGTLINPTNNSAPDSVIQALHDNSDHLPVIIDIRVPGQFVSGIADQMANKECGIKMKGSAIKVQDGQELKFRVTDLLGRKLQSGKLRPGKHKSAELLGPGSGLRILSIQDERSGCSQSFKILKR